MPIPFASRVALPIDPSEREFDAGTSWGGPRGDAIAPPPATPSGLPPVQIPGAWGIIYDAEGNALSHAPKKVAPNAIRYIDVPTTTNSGRILDGQAGFPIRGIQLDNYSKLWLYLTCAARYIPPYTYGVQIPVHFAPNKIEVIAAPPPNFVQLAANSSETFSVTCVESELDYSSGLSIPVPSGALSAGVYAYNAGVSGTITVPSNGKVIGITGIAGASAATMTINAGATINIPANSQWASGVEGQLVAPTIVFTSTVSGVVEWVV